ncbi:hypothetical protein E4U19_005128 [Claviceps sp. Clav32 group G5]|nr:hypothetical protein E4U19_005128 [Claviceps sp. Clav32 group G5]
MATMTFDAIDQPVLLGPSYEIVKPLLASPMIVFVSRQRIIKRRREFFNVIVVRALEHKTSSLGDSPIKAGALSFSALVSDKSAAPRARELLLGL